MTAFLSFILDLVWRLGVTSGPQEAFLWELGGGGVSKNDDKKIKNKHAG